MSTKSTAASSVQTTQYGANYPAAGSTARDGITTTLHQSPPNKKFPLLPKIINGGIAGIVGVSCVFSLDLVKTRLQNQRVGPGGERMYNGMFDCYVKTLRSEGLRGMYRGAGVNILLITPEKAIKLTANDFFRQKLTLPNGKIPIAREMLAGSLAGLFQIVVTTPMELLKIQLQDAGRTSASSSATPKAAAAQHGVASAAVPKKLSATTIALDLVKQKGILGLYRGTRATMLRDVSFSAIYFPLFANLNALGPRKSDGSGDAVFYHSFISGMGAGAVAAVAVTPADVVKTRIQTIKKVEGEKPYRGIADAFVRIRREEGVRALLKGAVPRMIVTAPLFGIAQTVYYIGVAEKLLGVKKTHIA